MSLIGRRLLAAVPVLVGVSLCTFFVLNALPGDAAEQLLGAEATPEQVERMRTQLNLDGSAWERYWSWVQGVLQGDLGRSLASGLPVSSLLVERLPVTLELLGYALALALAAALPTALLAAHRPGGVVDHLSTALSMASLSIPNYVFAVLLVYLFAVALPWFPSLGYTPAREDIGQNIISLTLPAIAIALPLAGFYSQFLRSDLLEQMQGEEYVITAAAKGLNPWAVLIRHALPNSLFGVLTVIGLHIGTLIGGTVIIERIFALPGVGQLLLQAVSTRDIDVVQGIILLFASATVIANLSVDLLYAVLDPRIRYGSR